MAEILPSHVRDFLRRLTEAGRSATTVQRCKTVLSSIFTTALNDQVIFLHPCSGVVAPPVPVKPLRILTPAEFEAIVGAFPDEQSRLLAEVAIQAGPRWGELVELRVGDLDPATRMLTIARTVVELRPTSTMRNRCPRSASTRSWRRKLRNTIASEFGVSIPLHRVLDGVPLASHRLRVPRIRLPDVTWGFPFVGQTSPREQQDAVHG